MPNFELFGMLNKLPEYLTSPGKSIGRQGQSYHYQPPNDAFVHSATGKNVHAKATPVSSPLQTIQRMANQFMEFGQACQNRLWSMMPKRPDLSFITTRQWPPITQTFNSTMQSTKAQIEALPGYYQRLTGPVKGWWDTITVPVAKPMRTSMPSTPHTEPILPSAYKASLHELKPLPLNIPKKPPTEFTISRKPVPPQPITGTDDLMASIDQGIKSWSSEAVTAPEPEVSRTLIDDLIADLRKGENPRKAQRAARRQVPSPRTESLPKSTKTMPQTSDALLDEMLADLEGSRSIRYSDPKTL